MLDFGGKMHDIHIFEARNITASNIQLHSNNIDITAIYIYIYLNAFLSKKGK